jgi:hypothetical protein
LQQGRVTFSLNGDVRYNSVRTAWIYDHARYILAETGDGWHWTGSPPGVFAKLDTRYLMSTGLVPYYPFSAPNDSVFGKYQQRIVPFTFVDQEQPKGGARMGEEFHGVANMPSPWRRTSGGWKLQGGIGAGGYHDSIGVLPRWDAMFLTAGSESAYRAMLANHHACCIGWTHFRRDDMSGDIHRWEDQPTAGYGATATDQIGVPTNYEAYYAWGSDHAPDVGFLPYLVTGAKFWCDEAIMQGVWTGQALVPGHRCGPGRLDATTGLRMIIWEDSAVQPRGAAWAWRTMACAAAACPDGHPNRKGFLASLANSAKFILDNCVRGTGWSMLGPQFVNNLGVKPQTHSIDTPYGASYMGTYVMAAWMEAFWTAAIGYGWDLCEDLFAPDQRAEYQAARDFAYKMPVGMAGPCPGGWCWRACGAGAISYTVGLYLPGPSRTSRFHPDWESAWRYQVEHMVGNFGYFGGVTAGGPAEGRSGSVSGAGASRDSWIHIQGVWKNGIPQPWSGRVTLQSSRDNATWTDVKSWAASASELFNDGLTGTIYYRLVVKQGDYGGGDVRFILSFCRGRNREYFNAVQSYSTLGLMDGRPGQSIHSHYYGGWIADTSYFANYIPSLAYAVTHKAPGAAESWARLMSASNRDDFMSDKSTYRNNPVWGIRVR